MVLEGCLKGSLEVVLTKYPQYYRFPCLELLLGHVLLFLVTSHCHKSRSIPRYLFIYWFQLCLASCVATFTFFYLLLLKHIALVWTRHRYVQFLLSNQAVSF